MRLAAPKLNILCDFQPLLLYEERIILSSHSLWGGEHSLDQRFKANVGAVGIGRNLPQRRGCRSKFPAKFGADGVGWRLTGREAKGEGQRFTAIIGEVSLGWRLPGRRCRLKIHSQHWCRLKVAVCHSLYFSLFMSPCMSSPKSHRFGMNLNAETQIYNRFQKFWPRWVVIIELYNCADGKCFM